MGCCLSQPEVESQEQTSRTAANTVASPSAPPPQYNERHDYVTENGKSTPPVQGESSSDRVPEQHQDEKKKHHSGDSSVDHADFNPNILATSIQHSLSATETPLTTSPQEANEAEAQTNSNNSNTSNTSSVTDDTSDSWPIIIRSSMAGKDITVNLPGAANTPFWTLYELRQHLEPQLQKIALGSASSSSTTDDLTLRIRFIYLGKVLPENTTLVPLSHHINNNNNSKAPSDSIILDKYGVIQAMVSKVI